jgi:hypothetical protein
MGENISKEKPTAPAVEVNATAFAKMAGCTKANVNLWITEGKLTHNAAGKIEKGTTASWRKVGNNTMIHIENAKAELLSKLNPRQVKNEKLFAFLGVDMDSVKVIGKIQDNIDSMNPNEVRTATEKEQLRILTLERLAMEGKYIERELVEKNMEAAGIAIKNIFKNLPPRATKDIREAPSDREAQNIFFKYIEESLLQVESEIGKDMARE